MIKISALLLTVFLIVPASVQAACVSGDIGGKWRIYTAVNKATEFWHICKVSLDSTGEVVVGTASTCEGIGGSTVDITAGQLTVARTCRVTGYLVVSGDTNAFDQAWMTRNTQMFSGVGHNPTTTFVYTAVRK